MTATATTWGTSTVRQHRRFLRRVTPLETPAADSGTPVEDITPSERWFEQLVETEPSTLLRLIASSRLAPEHLTFAAELAGRIPNAALVAEFLVPLLTHAHPVVREGAIYGLVPHLTQSTRAREALHVISTNDVSPGVRAAAIEALADVR